MEFAVTIAIAVVVVLVLLVRSRHGMVEGPQRGDEAAVARRHVGDDIEDLPVPGEPPFGSIGGSGFVGGGGGGGAGGNT